MRIKNPKSTTTYQVQINGELIKKSFKIVNNGSGSLWTQFNKYAKGRGAESYVSDATVIGGLVWILPNGDRMSIVKLLPNSEIDTTPPVF